ncbi:MAG: hypothetical protein QOE68_1161 [Thermoanaerobaculia bacterium]|jgi:hypothetical protein|nr:hypothetical protein [Thermoanaerobaculia bacterium]
MSGMSNAIEEVQRLLETLPEESSFEDIHYHIYVQQAIRRGRESVSRGELIDQDEMEKRMARWLGE